MTPGEADEIANARREQLEHALVAGPAAKISCRRPKVLGDVWNGYQGGPERPEDDVATGVARERLAGLLERLTRLPAEVSPASARSSEWSKAAGRWRPAQQALDWSAAEALALASLACDGYRVRLSGQDSERGHLQPAARGAARHRRRPRVHARCSISPDRRRWRSTTARFREAGVLGFEYGYSLDCPDGLVLWEAQFGDFVNVAQPIVDQFIASAEEKWRRLSGMVLLLPHGLEGQGPEHSSARLERFLMLAAEDNIQVVYPSTPAQYFHCCGGRRCGAWRKPLVVMTPKSLLRHPRCVSTLEDGARGRFQRVIADQNTSRRRPSRVLLTSGNLFYELQGARHREHPDVALLRLEQYYPLPQSQLKAALEAYPDGTPVYWVQEEPENMGAWYFLKVHFGGKLLERFPFAGIARPASASPATGSANSYRIEQAEIHARALSGRMKDEG